MGFEGEAKSAAKNDFVLDQSSPSSGGNSAFSGFEDKRGVAISRMKIAQLAKNYADDTNTAQLKATAENFGGQSKAPIQRQEKSNLPDNIKSGVENLSGIAMDDVSVHYNSDKPATVQAHAYAQGTDIHVAPGQEKHLPHEAWHVVQQKQGRVKPTKQLKEKVPINDDEGLEREADVMGAKAIQGKFEKPTLLQRVANVFSSKKTAQLAPEDGSADTEGGAEADGGKWATDVFGGESKYAAVLFSGVDPADVAEVTNVLGPIANEMASEQDMNNGADSDATPSEAMPSLAAESGAEGGEEAEDGVLENSLDEMKKNFETRIINIDKDEIISIVQQNFALGATQPNLEGALDVTVGENTNRSHEAALVGASVKKNDDSASTASEAHLDQAAAGVSSVLSLFTIISEAKAALAANRRHDFEAAKAHESAMVSSAENIGIQIMQVITPQLGAIYQAAIALKNAKDAVDKMLKLREILKTMQKTQINIENETIRMAQFSFGKTLEGPMRELLEDLNEEQEMVKWLINKMSRKMGKNGADATAAAGAAATGLGEVSGVSAGISLVSGFTVAFWRSTRKLYKSFYKQGKREHMANILIQKYQKNPSDPIVRSVMDVFELNEDTMKSTEKLNLVMETFKS